MTFDEAMEELGIDRDATLDTARRAYLRLLKKRKPEVDPEGFMRLREAYELVKAGHDFASMWRVAEPLPEAPRPVDAVPEEIVGPRANAAPDVDRATEAVSEEIVGPRSNAADAPVGAVPEVVEPSANAAGAPVDALPEEIVAPSANAAGAPRADDADDEEPAEDEADDAQEAPDPPPGLDVVEGMIGLGQYGAAGSMLAVLYDDATHDIRAHVPPIHRTLWLVFTLFAEGDHEAARKLGASAAGWMRANGQESRVLRGEMSARWLVARELSALPDGFSKVVRKAIARAALGDELGDARDALVRYQARRPAAAYEAAVALRNHAPTIASMFAATLEAPPAGEPTPATRVKGMNGWAMGAIAFALLRLLMYIANSSTTPSPTFDAPRFARSQAATSLFVDAGTRTSRAKLTIADLGERAKHRAERVRAHADYMMADAGKKRTAKLQSISKMAADAIDAIDREDCVGARAFSRDLRAALAPDAGDEVGRVEADTLDQAVKAWCSAFDESRRGAGEP